MINWKCSNFKLTLVLIIAHGKRAGPPRQLGRLSERWALVKFVPDKANDNPQRHIPADAQINDENASIFDNPTFAFNTDDENQQRDDNKQADGQVAIKPSSLRRSYSTDPDDEFTANDINVVGDDLLDSRNMRYYKIRVRR